MRVNEIIEVKFNLQTVALILIFISILIITFLLIFNAYQKDILIDSSDISKIDTGDFHSLVLSKKGNVYSFGYNGRGQLGDGSFVNRSNIKKIGTLENITDISAGGYHSISLSHEGDVYCWGWNNYKQIIDSDDGFITEPVKVENLPKIKMIHAGGYNSFAVSTDDKIYAWGLNTYGQLGLPYKEKVNKPTLVDTEIKNIKKISSAKAHTLILTEDNIVYSAGYNKFGQLGDGTTDNSDIFIRLPIEDVVDIETNSTFSVIVKKDGSVWMWGKDEFDFVDKDIILEPLQLHMFKNIKSISIGNHHILSLDKDGNIFVYGFNQYKQLGIDNAKFSQDSIFKINQISKGTKIASGMYHCLTIDDSNTLWGWGANNVKQLSNEKIAAIKNPIVLIKSN